MQRTSVNAEFFYLRICRRGLILLIYIKKLHSLYKLCKGDFEVGDIKLQRSLLQNSNFTITLSEELHHYTVSRVLLTVCNGEVGIL